MLNVIYSITNVVDQKRYIGQTKIFAHRKVEHLSALRRNVHHNVYLQRAWNKYGENCFEFEILQSDCEDLNVAEKSWISIYNTINNDCGYNCNKGGTDSSSKEQWRKVMIFDRDSGKLSGVFDTVQDCANAIGCHSSTVHQALGSPTRSAKNYFVRDYIEESIDLNVVFLKNALIDKKKRAGKIGKFVKKRQKDVMDNLPSKLLSPEELLTMITGEIAIDNIQNHGIDLNVIKISKLSGCGLIPAEGKTKLPTYTEQLCDENNCWHLVPGAYDIVFEQGCNIPSYAMLLIRQRSSLLRNGGIITSSIWDAGFKTDNMGTVMILNLPIVIEKGARIACIYGHACPPVTKLYSGQWQNDVQRKEVK